MTLINKLKNIANKITKIQMVALFILIIFLALLILSMNFVPRKDIVVAGEQMSNLADNIRKFYQNRPNSWGLNTKVVIKQGLAPQEMIKNGKLYSALHNEVLVGANKEAQMVMPGSRTFAIVYKGMDYDNCVDMASAELNEHTMLGITSIIISNQKDYIFEWGGDNFLPISRKNARNMCKKDNFLVWNLLL